jgi:hypothetical protein
MLRHWILLGAVLTTFFYLFVPGALWLVDSLLRNTLEQKLFIVKWHRLGILLALILWAIWLLNY